jgi:hypothetical protein
MTVGSGDANEALPDRGRAIVTIDRPVQHDRGDDVIVAQPRQEGQRFSLSVRDMRCKSLDRIGPATGPRDVGLDPILVINDPTLGVRSVLMSTPTRLEPPHLRAHLLGRHQLFLTPSPVRFTNLHTLSWAASTPRPASSVAEARKVRSGICARRANSQSPASAASFGRRRLPIKQSGCSSVPTPASRSRLPAWTCETVPRKNAVSGKFGRKV